MKELAVRLYCKDEFYVPNISKKHAGINSGIDLVLTASGYFTIFLMKEL